MNQLNRSGNNIPPWKALQEHGQDPFCFMISRESGNSFKNVPNVIPTKRAAQNRAAQKAFRQRRGQYIKELETKAQEVKETETQLTLAKEENERLRERVAELERQMMQFGKDPFGLDFDPFLDNGGWANELFPTADNEQVLDDLFAVLQTRQRPQIPDLNDYTLKY